MADTSQTRGGPDRSRASGREDYEVRYFAEAVGLDVEQVRKLIQRHGGDRATRDRDARQRDDR